MDLGESFTRDNTAEKEVVNSHLRVDGTIKRCVPSHKFDEGMMGEQPNVTRQIRESAEYGEVRRRTML